MCLSIHLWESVQAVLREEGLFNRQRYFNCRLANLQSRGDVEDASFREGGDRRGVSGDAVGVFCDSSTGYAVT